jgi:hypothetical protein
MELRRRLGLCARCGLIVLAGHLCSLEIDGQEPRKMPISPSFLRPELFRSEEQDDPLRVSGDLLTVIRWLMPPIDLPPQTPQEALLLDLYRPADVSPVAPSFRHIANCVGTSLEHSERPHGGEHRERPHGGEPDLRVLSSGGTPGTGSAAAYAVIIEPSLDSASNLIIEGIRLDRQHVIRFASAADYGRL